MSRTMAQGPEGGPVAERETRDHRRHGGAAGRIAPGDRRRHPRPAQRVGRHRGRDGPRAPAGGPLRRGRRVSAPATGRSPRRTWSTWSSTSARSATTTARASSGRSIASAPSATGAARWWASRAASGVPCSGPSRSSRTWWARGSPCSSWADRASARRPCCARPRASSPRSWTSGSWSLTPATRSRATATSRIPGIGRARRMQVRTPAHQHDVMIEAVENHMPEVIVIDEIGTELEAAAARTIAERGVQLIGTAHGNSLDNLMVNPTLSDLIGGIQSVTLGDEEARRRRTQKSVLERKAPPTFDVVVEIQDRDRVTVHADVAETVDALLRGDPLAPELRWRDEGGVHQSQSRPRPGPTSQMPGERFGGLVGAGQTGWRMEPGWRPDARRGEIGPGTASAGDRAGRGIARARPGAGAAPGGAPARGRSGGRGDGPAPFGPADRPGHRPQPDERRRPSRRRASPTVGRSSAARRHPSRAPGTPASSSGRPNGGHRPRGPSRRCTRTSRTTWRSRSSRSSRTRRV